METYINHLEEEIKKQILNGIKGAAISTIKGIANNSYSICLGIALTALLFYLLGFKKAGKWILTSVVIFYVLQILKVAL